MADIQLTYIQDLPAASALTDTDLFLLHQSGNEKSLTLLSLLSRVLSRQNPFADIKADGTVNTALSNLDLVTNGSVGRLMGAPKVFQSSGTYIPSAGTKAIIVQVQAGGGAGGNATSGTGTTASTGAGGGAGGYAESYLNPVPASASIVVGSGGVSAAGGNSSFNGTIIANGGAVGTSNAVSGATSFTGHARSGAGGTATGGNIYNSKGGVGTPAIITQGIPSGGNGGASQFSGSETGAGASGGAGGSGALGAGGSGAAQAIGGGGFGGGAGGDGIVFIWEYA